MRISMRSFCVGLLAGALWLGLGAGTARALSIDPNPLTEIRGSGAPGGSLSASLYAVSVEGNTAVFQLSVTTGTVTGIDVSMLFDSFTVPTVLDFVTGAAFAGTGIGGTAVVGPGGAEAQFDFAGGIGPGQTSRQLVVTFALPIQIGFVGAIDFDNGNATTRQYAVETPEPAALALFALGLGGFVLVRRAAR